ncbi:MAG TPA: dienelactone hydrolase family protein [Thermoanaerobaculia bacterium]|nr:dienelactone hydrolase family protein [Thermoanaerobaculia bacterium]
MNKSAAFTLSLLWLAAACQTTTTTAPPRLETTPRHDEWVDVRSDTRVVRTYVVYPQRSDRGPAIVLIHENRGLTDWVRTVADRIAEQGYIAIAPDLLSGTAPNGGGTKDFPTEDAAREAIGKLQRENVLGDLRAVVAYAKSIPSANGRVSVAGFCWGGGRTWDAANGISGLSASYVFYGTGPQDAAGVANIDAPVYGFYGGDDARVNATIPKSQELMTAVSKTFEPVTYEGAGHAFMRAGEAADATEANRKAQRDAWERWLKLLKGAP